MEEKVLDNKKHGMAVLLGTIAGYIVAALAAIFSWIANDDPQVYNIIIFIIAVAYMIIGWLPLVGLKVLAPQEALVLTLFGKYVGTLKGDGFYAVNPFCVAVNPAAKTKLNQSGDVSTLSLGGQKTADGANMNLEFVNKKMSLKTLSSKRHFSAIY